MKKLIDFYRGELNVEFYNILKSLEKVESIFLEFYSRDSEEYDQLDTHLKEFLDWLTRLKTDIDNYDEGKKSQCHICGRDATNLLYYTKNNKTYCVLCVFDFGKEQIEKEKDGNSDSLTIKQAFEKYGFTQIEKEPS